MILFAYIETFLINALPTLAWIIAPLKGFWYILNNKCYTSKEASLQLSKLITQLNILYQYKYRRIRKYIAIMNINGVRDSLTISMQHLRIL